MTDSADAMPLRTLIVDDEPLAVERMESICSKIDRIAVVGTAADGAAALQAVEKLAPDLLLLDMTMPQMDGLAVARAIADSPDRDTAQEAMPRPAIIFVTAHEHFAVEAFDLDAVDYVLKPVAADRLVRAIGRVLARRSQPDSSARPGKWLSEIWVPHRSELLRIDVARVQRIDAERDYVRLHVTPADDAAAENVRTFLLLRTIAGLEKRLDPEAFIRIHRSTILRRDAISGLRHDGLGVWSVEIAGNGPGLDGTGVGGVGVGGDKTALRIGRTYLRKVKAIAGR